jgi:hypothetical protein
MPIDPKHRLGEPDAAGATVCLTNTVLTEIPDSIVTGRGIERGVFLKKK